MAKKKDFRAAVLAELKRQKKSRYWLVGQLAGQIPASTVYEWLAGRHDLPLEKVVKVYMATGSDFAISAESGKPLNIYFK